MIRSQGLISVAIRSAADHLQGVKDKIRDLMKLQRTLTTISNECEGGIAPSCPIIEALYSRHP
jgi:hypothetical protein